MAFGQAGQIAVCTATLGLISFILGVLAENLKPATGVASTVDSLTVCLYPSDPTVALGSLSIVFLVLASVVGGYSIFFPYNNKAVPVAELSKSTMLLVFSILSVVLFFFAGGLLMWGTITEGFHLKYNTHSVTSSCPTAKTGLIGGAAFLSLDATLFWLVCQMLTMNVREDYFSYDDDVAGKASYGDEKVTSYSLEGVDHPAVKA